MCWSASRHLGPELSGMKTAEYTVQMLRPRLLLSDSIKQKLEVEDLMKTEVWVSRTHRFEGL